MFVKISNSLLELVYPRLCSACCDRLREHENILCLNCIVNLPQTHFHLDEENPMYQRLAGRINIQSAFALYYFSALGKVQELLHNLKYRDQPQIGVYLGELLGKRLSESEKFSNIDLIVPVPLFKDKEYKRGYNQSMMFAKGIANVLNVPVANDVLLRVKHTETQTRKSIWERWQNVETVFTLGDTRKLSDKHILLVDDVMTTGATLEACAEKLLELGNVQLSIATIAWAER